jgi:hypothetical protein
MIMLFEQLVESVLRRYHIGQWPNDEQDGVSRDRPHEFTETQEHRTSTPEKGDGRAAKKAG